jgi:hypothetical protein
MIEEMIEAERGERTRGERKEERETNSVKREEKNLYIKKKKCSFHLNHVTIASRHSQLACCNVTLRKWLFDPLEPRNKNGWQSHTNSKSQNTRDTSQILIQYKMA